MPSTLDNLTAAKANISALMTEITASPKPDYSIGGKSVSWSAYMAMLTAQLRAINEAIVTEGGPVELQTRAVS